MAQLRRGPAKRRSMTAGEFDTVMPFLRNISDDRKRAARMALVDDMTLQGIGNIFGWSRQAVSICVNTVWREFQAYQESLHAQQRGHLPEGWERVTLVAPSELIRGFGEQWNQKPT